MLTVSGREGARGRGWSMTPGPEHELGSRWVVCSKGKVKDERVAFPVVHLCHNYQEDDRRWDAWGRL